MQIPASKFYFLECSIFLISQSSSIFLRESVPDDPRAVQLAKAKVFPAQPVLDLAIALTLLRDNPYFLLWQKVNWSCRSVNRHRATVRLLTTPFIPFSSITTLIRF